MLKWLMAKASESTDQETSTVMVLLRWIVLWQDSVKGPTVFVTAKKNKILIFVYKLFITYM